MQLNNNNKRSRQQSKALGTTHLFIVYVAISRNSDSWCVIFLLFLRACVYLFIAAAAVAGRTLLNVATESAAMHTHANVYTILYGMLATWLMHVTKTNINMYLLELLHSFSVCVCFFSAFDFSLVCISLVMYKWLKSPAQKQPRY